MTAEEKIREGKEALQKGEWDRAFQLFHQEDLLSHASVLNYLAWLYMYGYGTARDQSRAIECLKKAADQHYSMALHNLGLLHEYGIAVEKDTETAKDFYRQAADLGLPEAQRQLSRLYMTDPSSNSDTSEAIYWAEQASGSDADHTVNSKLGLTLVKQSCKDPGQLWAGFLLPILGSVACHTLITAIMIYWVFPYIPGFTFIGTVTDAVWLGFVFWCVTVLMLPLVLVIPLIGFVVSFIFAFVMAPFLKGMITERPQNGQQTKLIFSLFTGTILLALLMMVVRFMADFFPNTFIVQSFPATFALAALMLAACLIYRRLLGALTGKVPPEQNESYKLAWVVD